MALTKEQQSKIDALGKAWFDAGSKEEKDKLHQQAEAIRNSAGFSGGADGSQHIPISNKPSYGAPSSGNRTSGSGGSRSTPPSYSYGYDPYGNPFDVEIKDGISYVKGTNNRPEIGSTIQTKGGIYKMGENYKGELVDSHNNMNQFNLDQQNQRIDQIWGAFEDYMNNNKQIEIPKGISAQEATRLAQERIGGLYDNNKEAVMGALDKNALSRGFYGQLPQDAFKNYKAQELENQKNSSIASLATEIQGQSEASALNRANAEMASQQNRLSQIVQALSSATGMKQNDLNNILSILGYKQSEKALDNQIKDSELGRELKIADYTGQFRGKPTLAYEMWMKDLGFKEDQIAQAKKEFSDSSARAWNNYRLNKDKFDYQKERDELGNPASEAEFQSKIVEKAQKMTDDWFEQYGDKDMRTDQVVYDPQLWYAKYNEFYQNLMGGYSLENDSQTGR